MINSNTDPRIVELLSSESRYFHNANLVTYNGDLMYDIPYSAHVDNDIDDEYLTITSKYQDRLDKVAVDKYNNPKLWWIIAIINNVKNPFELNMDEVLRIPTLGKLLLDEVI